MQKVAESIVFGSNEADPARRVLVLRAVFDVHLQEGSETIEEVPEARFV